MKIYFIRLYNNIENLAFIKYSTDDKITNLVYILQKNYESKN